MNQKAASMRIYMIQGGGFLIVFPSKVIRLSWEMCQVLLTISFIVYCNRCERWHCNNWRYELSKENCRKDHWQESGLHDRIKAKLVCIVQGCRGLFQSVFFQYFFKNNFLIFFLNLTPFLLKSKRCCREKPLLGVDN